MDHKKLKAFTLVELIVVVTILAILATIGFVSYSSYLTGVRDTNRLAQLVSIHDGLILYSTRKDLPLPDENVEVKIGSTNTIAYQGYAGVNTLETIDFTKGGQDPRDGSYFTYYLTDDRRYFQLMGFLEEDASITTQFNISNQTRAADYSNRIPTVYGRKLGVLTDEENTPIQEVSDVSNAGELDLGVTSDTYRAYFQDSYVLEGDSSILVQVASNYSCARIKEIQGGKSDGIYTLSTDAGVTQYNAYCPMSDLKTNLITEKIMNVSGDQGNYATKGSADENSTGFRDIPFGGDDIVWIANSNGDTANRSDGGFQYNMPELLDVNETYRFSVWFKKHGTNVGRLYFGTKGAIARNIGGVTNTNPYFVFIEFSTNTKISIGEWNLVVGYIHPEGYLGNDRMGGTYSLNTGEKLYENTADYIHENASNILSNLRVFSYDDFVTSNQVYFYDPRIEIVEASQVGDVSDLLGD